MNERAINAIEMAFGIAVLTFGVWLEYGVGLACIIAGTCLYLPSVIEHLRAAP